MQQETTITNDFSSKGYLKATGPVEVGMTNDYMFRVVFQRNKYALKGLLSSVLRIPPSMIKELKITNEIPLGVSIDSKEYRMDITLTMNDDSLIDLEMQVANYNNWQYRSLSYLCREYDNLDHGDDYEKGPASYQIGFLDFTLFEDHPELCATYQMRNSKDNYLYTDKFNLIVVELNNEELATEEDITSGIKDWVHLFKSKTWEELKMVAQNNNYMASTVESMYLSSSDYNIRKVAREREDYLRLQASKDRKIAELTGQNATLTDENARLRKLLEDNGIKP